MNVIIDYFLFVANRLVAILDSISFNGSASLLYYLLGAIIIGFIIKLIKGGSNEFEQNTNFLSSRIVTTGVSKYSQAHNARKQQLIEQQAKNKNKLNPSTTYLRLSPVQASHFGGRTRVTLQEYNDRYKN